MTSPVKLWRNQKTIRDLAGKTGRVVTWTVIRVPPAGFSDQAPYVVALVVLGDGKRITAQMVDCEKEHVAAGMRVVTVVRRVTRPTEEGIIPYGIKVKPL